MTPPSSRILTPASLPMTKIPADTTAVTQGWTPALALPSLYILLTVAQLGVDNAEPGVDILLLRYKYVVDIGRFCLVAI